MTMTTQRAFLWLGLLLLSSFPARSSDTATVLINATVVASTCTVDENLGTVNLPSVPAMAFGKKKGVVTGERDFVIALNDCEPSLKKVLVTASGAADADDRLYFKNSATGDHAATGVGLMVANPDTGLRYVPDGSVTDTFPLDGSDINNIKLRAGYISTNNHVTAGSFMSVVNVKFDYE